MKYQISQCQGCQNCTIICPDKFGLDQYSMTAYVKSQPTQEEVDKISCPHIVEVSNATK